MRCVPGNWIQFYFKINARNRCENTRIQLTLIHGLFAEIRGRAIHGLITYASLEIRYQIHLEIVSSFFATFAALRESRPVLRKAAKVAKAKRSKPWDFRTFPPLMFRSILNGQFPSPADHDQDPTENYPCLLRKKQNSGPTSICF